MIHVYRVTGPLGKPLQWNKVLAHSEALARIRGAYLFNIPAAHVHAFYLYSRKQMSSHGKR